MENLRDALDGVLKTIKDAAKDFSSVEVTTMTGDVKKIFNDEQKIDLKSTLTTMQGATGGEIRLLAHTHIDFDQDATQYFNEDIGEKDVYMLEMHQAMVDSAVESRHAFYEFVKEVFD